jgi:hypothetical protein
VIRRLLMSIAPLWAELRLVYWRAALRQINPLHPDVPEIVTRVNELETIRRTA